MDPEAEAQGFEPDAAPTALDLEDFLFDELEAEDDAELDAADGADDAPNAQEADAVDESDDNSDGEPDAVEEKDGEKEASNWATSPQFARAVEARVEAVRDEARQASERASRVAQQLSERMQQYDAHLARLSKPPELPDAQLIYDDPEAYQAAMHQYHHGQMQAQQAQQEREALQREHAQVMQQEQGRYQAEQARELTRLAPSLVGNAETLSALAEFASGQGYSDEQLSRASAVDWITLHKAMQWDQAQAAGKKLQQRAGRKRLAPKTTRPGPAKAPSTKASRQRQLVDRARSKKRLSGSDLEAMFLAELEAEE